MSSVSLYMCWLSPVCCNRLRMVGYQDIAGQLRGQEFTTFAAEVAAVVECLDKFVAQFLVKSV